MCFHVSLVKLLESDRWTEIISKSTILSFTSALFCLALALRYVRTCGWGEPACVCGQESAGLAARESHRPG